MQHLNYLLFFLFCGMLNSLAGQTTRYVDEIFTDINIEHNVVYATNISVLAMNPDTIPLVMDVYTPVGDTNPERPTVIYIPTGNFFPPYFNGRVTGGKSDSTVVEVCTRLAKRGYTAIAAAYRLGWNPNASENTIISGSFLQAIHRGIQDIRSCVRFLRKTVVEEGNPYGIDSGRIVAWGQETGGYLALGVATLDDYSEISALGKFINPETLEPYILENVHGDIYGETTAILNLPNSPGYSSEIHLAVSMGGAICDTSWIERDALLQPPIIGYHVVTDPFIPFGDGPVIMPHPNILVLPVSGTRLVVQVANEKGVNDPLDPINGQMTGLSAFLENRTELLADIPINLATLGQTLTTYATEHMYPFIIANNQLGSAPWEWWDFSQLETAIMEVNQEYSINFNATELHENNLTINSDMSAEKARAYIDTIFAHYLPRACQVLQLEECAIVASEEIADDSLIGLSVAPNPATERVFIRTNPAYPMEAIQVFDINGRYISSQYGIDNHQYELERGNLPAGAYLVKVKFAEGISVRKVIFR
ncbi:T9SS type A sorting domain-containing protein [Lewinella sp. LCG006]|uniref:T9SS type A sorting domain-containing protein n=1 Tax=Lewinella sp. LCG006 TaxID=3231911 RepID=UPI0034609BE9